MNRIIFDRFKGLNNVLSPHGLSKEFLTKAENVFVSNDFKLTTVPSPTSIMTTSDVSLLWGCDDVIIVVKADKLYRLIADSLVDLNYSIITPVDFVKVDNFVYIASFGGNRKLNTATNVINYWGLPNPAPPAIQVTGGDLTEATYLFATTVEDFTGLESGSSRIVSAMGTGFSLTVPKSSFKVNVYMSSPNGKELRKVGSLQPYEQTISITSPIKSTGNSLQTLGLLNPAYGYNLAYFTGRIFIGGYDTLFFTELYKYDYMLPENFISFESQLKYLSATQGALFIATYDGVYSLSPEMKLTKVLNGETTGLGVAHVRGNEIIVATNSEGVFVVGQQGVKNITENVFIPDFSTSKIIEDEDYIYLIGG